MTWWMWAGVVTVVYAITVLIIMTVIWPHLMRETPEPREGDWMTEVPEEWQTEEARRRA